MINDVFGRSIVIGNTTASEFQPSVYQSHALLVLPQWMGRDWSSTSLCLLLDHGARSEVARYVLYVPSLIPKGPQPFLSVEPWTYLRRASHFPSAMSQYPHLDSAAQTTGLDNAVFPYPSSTPHRSETSIHTPLNSGETSYPLNPSPPLVWHWDGPYIIMHISHYLSA